MYDDLVKVLRETDFSDGCPCGAEPLCENKDCVILQAADAIEKLSNYVDTISQLKSEGWHLRKVKRFKGDFDSYDVTEIKPIPELPKVDKGRFDKWIPVAQQMPKLPDDDFCSVMVIANVEGWGVTPMVYERVKKRDGKLVERWRHYWDRICHDKVTHWMPLPEPPKADR